MANRRTKKKAAGKGCVLVACIEANTFPVKIDDRDDWKNKIAKSIA
jgi:hypothetical protein